MRIKAKQYAKALFDAASTVEKNLLDTTLNNFCRVLIANNDSYKIDQIFKEFDIIWNREFSVVKTDITSAHKIDNQTAVEIEKYVKNRSHATSIEMEQKIDTSILGGIIVKYGDKIYDASLRTQLDKLRHELLRA